jgi:hypothetical protein
MSDEQKEVDCCFGYQAKVCRGDIFRQEKMGVPEGSTTYSGMGLSL